MGIPAIATALRIAAPSVSKLTPDAAEAAADFIEKHFGLTGGGL